MNTKTFAGIGWACAALFSALWWTATKENKYIRAKAEALLQEYQRQTPCDEAVKESRRLFDQMLQLRRESIDTLAQNKEGAKTNEPGNHRHD